MAELPSPPRLTGQNPTEDASAILSWAYQLYQVLEREQGIVSKSQRLRAVVPLTQTISASPTQDEVEAIQTKINEIITILNG